MTIRADYTPTQRVLAKARIKGPRKVIAFGPWINVEGLPQRVRHNIITWRQMHAGTLKLGTEVRLKVRHIVLDEGTENERYVWDTLVVGDVHDQS